MDEIATPSDTDKAQPTTAKGPVRAYHESVLGDRQRRVSEFIPLRPFAVIMTLLLLLTAVAVIEALYIFTAPLEGHAAANQRILKKPTAAVAPAMPTVVPATAIAPGAPGAPAVAIPAATSLAPATKALPVHLGSDHAFAALDLAARGNIGSWFSSLLFAGGCLAVLGLLSIRAHRVDDYRGRYRVWWWIAGSLLWASVDTATGLHDALGQGLQILGGDTMPGGRKLMWIGVYGMVFGTLATRAAFEIWSSLLAVVSMSCAALLYFACIGLQLEMLPALGDAVLTHVVTSSLTLLAHVTLVYGVLLYARHVHLDAQGRLLVNAEPKAKKKPKSKAKLAVVADDEEKADKKAAAKKDDKKEVEKKEADKKEAAAPAASKPTAASNLKFGSSSTPQASASISSKTNTAPAKQDEDDDEEEDDDDLSSKAERRRLKKLARREGQQGRRAA